MQQTSLESSAPQGEVVTALPASKLLHAVTCCYHSAALQSRLNWSHQEQHELQHEAERTQLTPPGRESARETRENFEKNAFERFSKVLEGSNMLQHLICFRHFPFSSFSRFWTVKNGLSELKLSHVVTRSTRRESLSPWVPACSLGENRYWRPPPSSCSPQFHHCERPDRSGSISRIGIQQDPTGSNRIQRKWQSGVLQVHMEYSKKALKERKSLKLLKPFADLSGLPC